MAICVGLVFAGYLIDELLPASVKNEQIGRIFQAVDRGKFTRYFATNKGTQFEAEAEDWEKLRPGMPAKIAYTPFFHLSKDWVVNATTEYVGNPNPGKARQFYLVLYALTLGLAALAVRTRSFELRISITFLLSIFLAVHFWFYEGIR